MTKNLLFAWLLLVTDNFVAQSVSTSGRIIVSGIHNAHSKTDMKVSELFNLSLAT